MTENTTKQQSDTDGPAILVGIIMVVVLSIILGGIIPGGMRNINHTASDDLTEESTQVAQIIVEETEAVVETEVAVEETEVPSNSVESEENEVNIDTTYDPEIVALGETLFVSCAACHGADGTGIDGLGKNLISGEFSLNATDEELANVIINGRPIWDPANTTMVDMPPRGGNPTLTDDDIIAIVAYLRTRGAESDAVVVMEEVPVEETEIPSNNVESEENEVNIDTTYDPEIVAVGEILFVTCTACHGADGTGIEGLGRDLVNGEFVTTATDEELVELITIGRPVWDPANTTMIDMPPRGGNPTLTDDDIIAIVAYLRTLGAESDDVDEIDSESSSVTDSDAYEDSVSIYNAESIANGETLFVSCAACHGADGTGIDGLGKNLIGGEFSLNATDEELANVIINGRPIWDPANTTMIDMPPRGGNPTLAEEDINDIIAYIRSLQSP